MKTKIQSYIDKIRNPIKKAYAQAYYNADKKEVERLGEMLSCMARQAVMMNILALQEVA